MLVRLFGSNFRSLKTKFELSLVAADMKRKEDRNRGIIDVQLAGIDEPLRLLRTVAIFGHNGSGKSTVLVAASALHWLVKHSSAQSKPGGTIPPYEPFLLDNTTREAPVTLGCEVVHGESLLRYEISYRAKAIETEVLTALNGTNEVTLIDRQPSGVILGDLITGSDANQLYVKAMQPNVAVLSKLAQHGPAKGPDSVQSHYKAIVNATMCADYSAAAALTEAIGDSSNDRFADDEDYRKWIMQNLIAASDVGIRDVRTSREDIVVPDFLKQLASGNEGFKLPEKRVVVAFVHGGADSRALAFSDESAGTKKLFNIAGDWWALSHQQITLLADELGASLHPRLLDALVRAVNDAPSERRSQLIFATHDTGLLEGHDGEPPALRRDQVYFSKKDGDGASELYSLAEFREGARPVHNLRKRYLSGLYGAIPLVERLSL